MGFGLLGVKFALAILLMRIRFGDGSVDLESGKGLAKKCDPKLQSN